MAKDDMQDLAKAEIDRREYELLMRDFNACREMKSKSFEPDTKELLDKLNAILAALVKDHIVDLNLNKWYIAGFDDPKALTVKLKHLKGLLADLYREEFRVGVGKVKLEMIPTREGLIATFIGEMHRNVVDPRVIESCKALVDQQIMPLFKKVVNTLDGMLVHVGDRNYITPAIVSLRTPLESLFSKITELLNHISYIDSIMRQLKTEVYSIEHHMISEMVVRKRIMDALKKGENCIDGGSVKVYILPIAEAAKFAQTQGVNLGTPFDERDRFESLSSLFLRMQRAEDDQHKKLLKELRQHIQISSKAGDAAIKQFFQSSLFFNFGKHFVVYQDQNGALAVYSDAGKFNSKIMQFLIFREFKTESFDKLLDSIVEPYFLNPVEMMSFLNYKSGWHTSWKMAQKILRHQLEQGDITERDHKQIYEYMRRGFAELRLAQVAVEKERASVKKPKYSNFIKRPYLVHQLMMDVLRLAVVSEARAKTNLHKETVYTGRESGFEGGNTVSVHGYNNYLKYRQMIKLIEPVVEDKMGDIFDKFEQFKAWLMMGIHDAATYDRQNAISFSDQLKFKNNNKKAHDIIGAYLIRENKIIKKLFNAVDDKGAAVESEEKNDLNLLANVINNHDYTKMHLDVFHMGTDNPNTIKKLILYSVSGLADNSAGIGFLDEQGLVKVDPWEEKGSSIFLVPAKEANFKSNGELMFEILSKLSRSAKYFKSDAGKAEWTAMRAMISANVNALPAGIERDKLLRGLATEFSPRSATSTAGVLNSGVMKFIGYDGKTLKIELIMDSLINKILTKLVGKDFVFERIGKFLGDYGKNGLLDIDVKKIPAKKRIRIYNCNKEGKKLDTVGVDIKIVEQKGIITKTLIEDASKQLLTDLRKVAMREFKVGMKEGDILKKEAA